jgi:hypothetical protein
MNKREITKKNLQQGVLKRLVEDCSNPLKYLLKRMKEKKFLGLLSKDASSSHTLLLCSIAMLLNSMSP